MEEKKRKSLLAMRTQSWSLAESKWIQIRTPAGRDAWRPA
jgi:hypothetical protein